MHTNKNLKITSGLRDIEDQASKFFYNCMQGGPCNPDTCNPLPRNESSPVTGDRNTGYQLNETYASSYKTPAEQLQFIIDAAKENRNQACPHLTGYTVDIWPEDAASFVITDVDEFVIMENAMRSNGFCRIYHEPWHFEMRGKASSAAAKSCNWTSGVMRFQGREFNYGECSTVNNPGLRLRTGAVFKSGQCKRVVN